MSPHILGCNPFLLCPPTRSPLPPGTHRGFSNHSPSSRARQALCWGHRTPPCLGLAQRFPIPLFLGPCSGPSSQQP